MKCFDCKKRRKLYTVSIDPDIHVENRCKECLKKWKEELLMHIFIEDIDNSDMECWTCGGEHPNGCICYAKGKNPIWINQ